MEFRELNRYISLIGPQRDFAVACLVDGFYFWFFSTKIRVGMHQNIRAPQLSGKVYSGKKLTLTFAPYETMVFSCRWILLPDSEKAVIFFRTDDLVVFFHWHAARTDTGLLERQIFVIRLFRGNRYQ